MMKNSMFLHFSSMDLIIDYDNNTDELVVNELEGVRSGKYSKGNTFFP